MMIITESDSAISIGNHGRDTTVSRFSRKNGTVVTVNADPVVNYPERFFQLRVTGRSKAVVLREFLWESELLEHTLTDGKNESVLWDSRYS